MSWLRQNGSRQNNTSNNRNIETDCDPKALYDSFCKHWQQAFDIIQRSESSKPSQNQNHDDVLGVVNHLDHMVTLILVELHNCNKITLPGLQQQPAPCLEFMLSENLLDKLYEWGIKTGRYSNAVRLEQLKLYELLVSHSRHQLLMHEPFLRPLLKILASSQGEIFPPDVEKRLVILLNQLCVVLMQNVHLLDLFFFSTSQQQQGLGHGTTNFILFSLLIPYVHREGSLGHQARDALLLCMALSQKNSNVGTYIAKYSSMSPVLVTGLGGLYSLLPNSIEIITPDWYRITPDDVAEISELTLFMNSLEFCNAVVQVAHTLIQKQLLDFMYQGFLIPILGPAILQIFNGSNLQNNIDSQISAMAYLDLILRSITEPGLLKIFIQFLLVDDKFDGERIIDVLVERLNTADSRLCIVTLSLFDTLLSLNCEDIMLELLLKYLNPCQHIPILHRHKINKIDPYLNSINYFLDLTPELMKFINNTKIVPPISKTIGANWNHYGSNTRDTLYSNYHAYLIDARHKISQCKQACDQWSNNYKYQKMPNNFNNKKNIQQETPEHVIEMIRNFMNDYCNENDITTSSTLLSHHQQIDNDNKCKQLDSLQSLGESSGYESLKCRPDDFNNDTGNLINNNNNNNNNNTKMKKDLWKISNQKVETIYDLDLSEDLFRQGTVSLGPFLNAIWGKLQTFSSNCLYVNLHLTGLLTRLSWYPLPIIQSILLRPDIPTTSETPSFYQVLKILKQQMDAELPVNEDSLELIDNARSQLVDREYRLINIRKNTLDTNNKQISGGNTYTQTTTANLSATTPIQLTPSSSYDPFKRGDSKRRSISNSFSNIFRRPSTAATSGLAQIKEFFTGTTTTSTSASFQETNSEPALPESSMPSIGFSGTDRNRDLAICAVIFDEWLKELSSISKEQSIVMLADSISNL